MRRMATICSLLLISAANAQQTYPNVEGETLLEDDRVIVQRFVLEPGQWEGIHEHPEHQLVIVVNATDELTYRIGDSNRVFKRENDEELQRITSFWRPGPVLMSDDHESGNTGTRPLEWIAITFKSESIATDDPPEQFVEETDESDM
jgi:predicted metal-dependent enzyme (double-stranded beta helix superfamily)